MDSDAVSAADDETLKEMGISTKGDLVALRAFCEKKSGIKKTGNCNRRAREKAGGVSNVSEREKISPIIKYVTQFQEEEMGSTERTT